MPNRRGGQARAQVTAEGVSAKPWSVYMLRCAAGSLYTGITTDVARRMEEHASGRKGAKCLRGRGPFALVLRMEVGGLGQALVVERRIKRLPKMEKELLLRSPHRRAALLSATSGYAISGKGQSTREIALTRRTSSRINSSPDNRRKG